MISYAYLKLFLSTIFIHLSMYAPETTSAIVGKRDKTLNLFAFGEGQHPFS